MTLNALCLLISMNLRNTLPYSFMSKNMQELLAEEWKKYTATALTNYEKLIKVQSFVGK